MSVFGLDANFWRAIDERFRTFFAKDATRRLQVQIVEVGAGDDTGKVKVRDPEGGFSRDIFYPQTNPRYIPSIDDWVWALTGEGGLLILSPEPGSPIGAIEDYGGTTDPPGGQWFLMNGRVFAAADYPAAFSVLGTTYNIGGETAGSFRIPDGRGRTTVGAGQGTGLTNRVLGTKFGEENHLTTVAEMPAHGHTASGGSHSHTASGGSHSHTASGGSHSHGASGGSHGHTGATQSGTGNHEHTQVKTAWTTSDILATGGTTGKDFLSLQSVGTTGGGAHGHGLVIDSATATPTIAAADAVPTIAAAGAVPTIDAANAVPTIANTGGGGVHNNMQPSLVLNQIIRLA